MAPKKAKLNLMRKTVYFSATSVASHSLKVKPKSVVWLERSPHWPSLLPSTPSSFLPQDLGTYHSAYLQCFFDFSMPFYKAQPKLHILSFLIALFTALPSSLFLTSGAFYHIILCIFYAACCVCSFRICLLPLEWNSLNLTLSNLPLSALYPDQGPPCNRH